MLYQTNEYSFPQSSTSCLWAYLYICLKKWTPILQRVVKGQNHTNIKQRRGLNEWIRLCSQFAPFFKFHSLWFSPPVAIGKSFPCKIFVHVYTKMLSKFKIIKENSTWALYNKRVGFRGWYQKYNNILETSGMGEESENRLHKKIIRLPFLCFTLS